MMDLIREKSHKWIMQKNISSSKIIKAYLDVVSKKNSKINFDDIKNDLKNQSIYKGRSDSGSISTMGVRFSQMCYYMFGYKVNNCFIPSPMTENLLNENCSLSKESNMLINLFSMQFPNPYSDTNSDFCIYVGRLIVKLLLDERIEKKLYIDEILWFLPFIEKVDENIYNELIKSIIEYRSLSFEAKYDLFRSIKNYDDLFSNVTHEMNYYFLRIFRGFGVFDIIPDKFHNDGNLFKFHHGKGDTYRYDSFDSGKKYSGYVKLNDNILNDAIKLNNKFSAFDLPTTMNSEGIYSKRDWLTALYDTEPLNYLSTINTSSERIKEVSDIVNNMVYSSKYGSRDGKEFEESLKPLIELFRETCNVEIISGAGNTDLLCAMEDVNENTFKMNVDAKTRKAGLEEINSNRLENHLRKHGSEFCMVVAPRFASGISGDIYGHKIVTIKAEDLGTYCYKESINSADGFADFLSIKEIIDKNMGKDITNEIRELTEERYGIFV